MGWLCSELCRKIYGHFVQYTIFSGIDLFDKEDLYMIHDVKKLTDVESIKKELQ